MDEKLHYLGFDIGGTKFLVVLTDASGKILDERRAATPPDLEDGLNLLCSMGDELAEGHRITGIGATIGGPLDSITGVVSPLHQPEWKEVPLKALMEAHFSVPFRVEVDTDAAALAEWKFDSSSPESLYYITLSTGLGGGFVRDGMIYRGMGKRHPEFGHQAVPVHPNLEGREIRCGCGSQGCLEALVSGNALRKIYGHTGEELTETEWDEVAFHVGGGIRNLAHLLSPEVVRLGGGMSLGGGSEFVERVKHYVSQNVHIVPAPRIELSSLGYYTAAYGAAVLAMSCQSG